MEANESGRTEQLSETARERFERVACRIAGETWGGRWRPVSADELVDVVDEGDLAASA